MALFTHSHTGRTEAEVNPAAAYFEAVVVCRGYVDSRSKTGGTKYSSDYRELESQGFKFVGHVHIPGKQPQDVIMVKPAAAAVDANSQAYRRSFASFQINRHVNKPNLVRVVYSYQWDNYFSTSVIAGDCNADEMQDHLVALASDADKADVLAWIKGE